MRHAAQASRAGKMRESVVRGKKLPRLSREPGVLHGAHSAIAARRMGRATSFAVALRTKAKAKPINLFWAGKVMGFASALPILRTADAHLLEPGAAHGDAAQAVAADLLRRAQREIQHPALRERPTILHWAFDPLAVLHIGDDEDGAERLGAVGAGDFMGLEALAARIPFVFPVDGGFLVVRRRARDAAHPHLLEGLGLRRKRR